MLLSDKSIRASINDNKIFKLTGSNTPLSASDFKVKSASVDLSIGKIYEPTDDKVRNEKQLADLETKSVRFQPGDTLLIEVKERFNLANNIGGIVFPPNRLSKDGIIMTNPGHIDPGYRGHITVCLVNMGKDDVDLKVGDVIGRLLLIKVNGTTEGYTGVEVHSVAPEHLNKLGRDFAGIGKRIPVLIRNILFKWLGITLPAVAFILGVMALVIPELSKYRVEAKEKEQILIELIRPLESGFEKKLEASKKDLMSEIQSLKTEINALKQENFALKSGTDRAKTVDKGSSK